jgi:hypothetical protein
METGQLLAIVMLVVAILDVAFVKVLDRFVPLPRAVHLIFLATAAMFVILAAVFGFGLVPV